MQTQIEWVRQKTKEGDTDTDKEEKWQSDKVAR
jgi:hypothetical protein